ncbi:hypothetical protein ACOMHN_032623 [Nucella lapillus]
MDNNIIASKEDYKKMDYKIEKILIESFEIRKENIMLKKQIETLTRHCQDMSDEVKRLEKKVKEGKEMRNNLEQYTRKDNIKIINLQGDKPRVTSDETEKRVVDFLHSQLGLPTITSDHISIAHRVGPYRQSQNRPIIVKFISRKTKVSVMKNKRNLKGQKIYINEDLTKLNAQRLAELKKHIGVLSAWSFEGSLYCKLINLEKIKIEDGGIGVIDRLLIDTPRSQQQGFQQRPGGFGGRESRPTFIGRAVRETRGRDRGGTTRYSGYSGATGQTGSGRQEARPSPSTGSGRQEARPSPSTDGPRHGSYIGATGQTGSGRQEARPSPSTDGRGPDDEERPSQGGTLSPVPDRGDIAEIFADDMNTDYPGDADSLWHAEMCDVLAEKELGGVSPSLVPTGAVTLSQRPDNTEVIVPVLVVVTVPGASGCDCGMRQKTDRRIPGDSNSSDLQCAGDGQQ